MEWDISLYAGMEGSSSYIVPWRKQGARECLKNAPIYILEDMHQCICASMFIENIWKVTKVNVNCCL